MAEQVPQAFLQELLGERHQEIIAIANLTAQFVGAVTPYVQALEQTAQEIVMNNTGGDEELDELFGELPGAE